MIVGVLCKIVEVIFDLLTPIIVARMIDVGVTGHDTGVVTHLGVLLMVFAVIGYCFTLVCQKMAALVSQGSGTDVRNALFEKVYELSTLRLDEIDGRRDALAAALAGELPIIAAGGVLEGAQARAKLEAGAALVQLYSGLIYRGPALVRECVRATAG